jgi:hypothetical protein
MTPETCQQWNPVAGEWQAVAVEVTPEPRRHARSPRTHGHRLGTERDLTGLSSGSPLPAWWRDTAYAPGEPLADMRSFIKPSMIKTHRAATVMPADPGRITVTA